VLAHVSGSVTSMSGAAAFDFTVTSDAPSMATRSPTFKFASSAVGLHTPLLQFMSFVAAFEIVTDACAVAATRVRTEANAAPLAAGLASGTENSANVVARAGGAVVVEL